MIFKIKTPLPSDAKRKEGQPKKETGLLLLFGMRFFGESSRRSVGMTLTKPGSPATSSVSTSYWRWSSLRILTNGEYLLRLPFIVYGLSYFVSFQW
jgi:hypothetical protein